MEAQVVTDISDKYDAQQIINRSPFGYYQWMIAILCFLVVFVDGIDTAAMGYIAPALAVDWGVNRADLGPIMSAALVGMIIGALFSGPTADKLGRKKVILLSLLVFGGATLACAWAENLTQLMILRCIAGIGLGAAMPNCTTLFSEYCPDRIRSLMVTCMFCGYNLGMAMGGFVSGWLIPQLGWQSLFIIGGIAPLILSLVILVLLPESYRYLLIKRINPSQVRTIISKIARQKFPQHCEFYVHEDAVSTQTKQATLSLLFSRKYLKGTVLLWATYFLGLIVVYLLTSWLPTLLSEAGATMQNAAFIGGLFQLGGVLSALFIGWAMDHYNPNKVIATFYFTAGVCVLVVGHSLAHWSILTLSILCAGAAVNGAQSAMPVLSARFYPTYCRATGVAWMSGVGRFGAVFGAWVGALLLGYQFSFTAILDLLFIPAVAAAVAIWLKSMFTHTDANT